MATMHSLNEMFVRLESKGCSPAISTYNTQEAGGLDLSYQLEMTINAKVSNLSSKKQSKLVSHMISLGYDSCRIDKSNNKIYVNSINGINPACILKYVKNHVDASALEQKATG